MPEIDKYELPISQPLTAAYINGDSTVIEQLYGYSAGRQEDWKRRLEYLQQHKAPRSKNEALAEVLKSYNIEIGASELTIENINHIANGAPVVIGGQQAGLWSGPLLVIHKAVSIIKAAQTAQEQLRINVIPVFWIAGEDHDWDEVNHTYVISAEQELKKLEVQRSSQVRTSISKTTLTSDMWEELIHELSEVLPSSEFKESILHQFKEITSNSSTLSDCFAKIMSNLFSEYGLVFIDSDYKPLRSLEQPMFLQMLQQNDQLETAFQSAAHNMKQLGFAPSADVHNGSTNLFFFHPEHQYERILLYKADGKYFDRKRQYEWSSDELLKYMHEQPELFSNNVLTRPIMQDYLFPVLATVLGPGEVSYWGLTKQAFEQLNMEMPIIVPRMSYTLVEGIIAKNMLKYELTFRDVMDAFPQKKEAWLKAQDQYALEEKFNEVKEKFTEMYSPLIELSATIQAGLAKLGDTNLNKIIEQITYLENRAIDAQHKQFDAAIRQLDRISLSIKPLGKPQERALSMVSFMNRYGNGWVDSLINAPYSTMGGHTIIHL